MKRKKRSVAIKYLAVVFLSLLALVLSIIMLVAAYDRKVPVFDVTKNQTNYDRTLKVAVTSDYAPLSYLDKNGNPTGFDVELVYKLGEILQANMEVHVVSWEEALQGVMDGVYDFATDAGYSKERTESYELTAAYLSEGHVIVTNNEKYLSLESLSDCKIAALKGDFIEDMVFAPNKLQDNVIWLDSIEQALVMVNNKEADLLFAPDFIAENIISNKNLTNLYLGDTPVHTAQSCLCCKKGNVELCNELDIALQSLKESGGLTSLKDKWINTETKIHQFFGDFGVPLISGMLFLAIALTILFMVNDSRNMKELQEQEDLFKKRLELDELTGLYTKSMAKELIDVSLKYEENPAAFMVFNMDGLKSINDSLGHEAGDSAIKNFAVALRDYFGSNTILARMSGDEFIGYAKCDDNEKELKIKLEKFIGTLRNFTTGGVVLRCCVGATIVGKDNRSFSTLFKQGDTAMYLAKTNGKNQVVIYKKSMENELLSSSSRKMVKMTADSDFSVSGDGLPSFIGTFAWMLDNFVMEYPDTLLMSGENDRMLLIDLEDYNISGCYKVVEGKLIKNADSYEGQKCHCAFHGEESRCADCVVNSCNHNTYIIHTSRNTVKNQAYVVRSKLVNIEGKEYLMQLAKAVSNEAEMNHEYEMATASQNLVTASDYLDINPMLDSEGFFKEQIRIISQFYGAESGYVLRMDADMETATYNIPTEYTPHFSIDMSEYAREKWADMVDKSVLAYVPDVEQIRDSEPNGYAALSNSGIKNYIIAPIWDQEKVYGYMCLKNMTKNLTELGTLGTIAAYFKRIMQALVAREETINRRYYDPMTGYLSFEGFRRQLDSMNLYNCDKKYALCSWDIRRFKYLNDAYGYDMGDKIIQEVADLFARRLQEEEYLCRVNADRFGALCAYEEKEDLQERLNNLADYATDYFNLNYNGRCLVELSIGIYPLGDFEEVSVDDMLNMAIIAKKNAKQAGGNTSCIYDEKLRNASKKEMLLQAEMEEALEAGEFKVYLQPQVYIGSDSDTAGILRAEALCRWIREDKMYATPAEFIPLFEHNGMITALDYYMIESVCKLIDAFHKKEERKTCIAVNVSRVTFLKGDFLANFDRIISKYDIRPGELELEFTEGVAVTDFERFYEVIEEVKKRGMECAMDDFGSDYSNLNVLQKLPLDVLKLDKKFFDYNETGKRGEAIVGNTIKMAKDLEMTTIAEGIESIDQVEALKKASCDYIQGFVYARPMPAEEYLDWVRDHAVS